MAGLSPYLTALLAVLGTLATFAGAIYGARVQLRIAGQKAALESGDKREERFSAEAREMLAGYRADIAGLRAELATAERRADEREAAYAAKVEGLNAKVDEQRDTIRALKDEVALVRRENSGLRAQVARLTGLAAGAEADTAGE